MFFDNLSAACRAKNISVTSIVTSLGLSKSNVTNWKKGASPSGDLIVRFSELLNVSCDYLLTGKNSLGLIEKKESEIESLYMKLDNDDKNKVIGYIKGLLEADKYQKIPKFKPVFKIPHYDMPASAGTGMPLDDEIAQTAEISGDVPPNQTDYVIRIAGNSMEPKFQDGDFIYVQKVDTIELGDIGIFYLDGNVYIKKYTRAGLESLNHEYDLIPADEEVKCLGKVLRKVRGEVTL